jgi:hypothetical protein
MPDSSTTERPILKWETAVHSETHTFSMSFGYMDGEATAAVWDDAQPERMVFIPAQIMVIALQQGWIPQPV